MPKKKVLVEEVEVEEPKVDPRRVRLDELDKTPLSLSEWQEKKDLEGLADEGKI